MHLRSYTAFLLCLHLLVNCNVNDEVVVIISQLNYFWAYAHVTGYVYVIVRVGVVFGINCASNAGQKLVIVRGAAEYYYCFLPALREQLIQNTTATCTVTN